MTTTLVSRDSKDKIRVAYFSYDWNDEQHGFVISRQTGCYNGKITQQPDKIITKGKASRTLKEQVQLEFNSLINKSKDKGYKEVFVSENVIPFEETLEEYSEESLNELIGENKTDSNGFAKHMLAKQADKVKQSSIDKVEYWYASRKIDGVRLSLYWDGENILTASRGGKTYEYSTIHLTKHPKLIQFFQNHPDYILDGELYKHGKSLQQISGAARLEKNAYDCDWLEYYIYDVMLPIPFENRYAILNQISEELELGFNPNRQWNEGELQIQMVPQERVSGYNNIMLLHNQYVSEGWEGCVIRDPSKEYKFGGRGNEMIKIKIYQDAEFEITGISEGLREEDMCFTCITSEGISFKAKPLGSREIKEQYRENLSSIIGKMATVKFFYYSDDGTPLQPVLKAIRDYE